MTRTTTDPLDDMAHRLTVSIVRLNRLIRQSDASGLTPSMSAALACVARTGTPTLGELAAEEHLSPATMTPIVKKLEAMRLLARVPDPDDGRITRVRITPAGRRRLDETRGRRVQFIRARLGELPARDVERLADALDVLGALTERSAVVDGGTR